MALPPRGVASLCILLVTIASSSSVAAGPVHHAVMEWSRGDASCIGAPELTSMVERTLARSVFRSDGPATVRVSGAVGRVGPDRFEARIVLFGGDGRILAKRTLLTAGDSGWGPERSRGRT